MKGRICSISLVSLALASALSPAALAVAGQLDSSFNGNGKAMTHFRGGDNYARDVALQPDGRIVVVGQVLQPSGLQPSKIALVRFNTNGTLDISFGGDGKVRTVITHYDDGEAVVIQPNGKIVVVGRGAGNGGRFLLVRYRPSGRLDKTFSGDGVKLTNFTNGDDIAFAVALQGDGKIIVAGAARGFNAGASFAIARYKRHGRLDRSFGSDGRVQTNFTILTDQARDVAIQPDGKIVAAGAAAMFANNAESGFALARYNTDGTLDSSFDADGKVTVGFDGGSGGAGGSGWAAGVAIQDDGKIVAAGPDDGDFALARLEIDGTPDAGFGSAGKVLTGFSGFAGAYGGLALQPDGKIVAAGTGRDFLRFALARYETDGSLDSTFSGDGKVVTHFVCCDTGAQGVAIQANGKIVAAGDQGESASFAVARYLGG
jgi:uncharacterized delta-60 repeat protein